jgi:hypothetical protein
MADLTKTVFGDFGERPLEIIRVSTTQSVYTVSIHEDRGRKYAVVRGSGDRENVVVRDSEPRVGERSLFELPVTEWIGKILDAGGMKTTPITEATLLGPGAPPGGLPHGAPYRPETPGYTDHHPEIVPTAARGTRPGVAAQSMPMARQVVVGPSAAAAEPVVPYPERHVQYAENIGHLLRSLHRRTTILDDCSAEQRRRLRAALEEANLLLAQLRGKLG